MTTIDRQAWLTLFGIAWQFHTATRIGHVTDADRAHQAAQQANRGLQALRDLRVEVAEGRIDLPHVTDIFEEQENAK